MTLKPPKMQHLSVKSGHFSTVWNDAIEDSLFIGDFLNEENPRFGPIGQSASHHGQDVSLQPDDQVQFPTCVEPWDNGQ
jgi:hypothetical protein